MGRSVEIAALNQFILTNKTPTKIVQHFKSVEQFFYRYVLTRKVIPISQY